MHELSTLALDVLQYTAANAKSIMTYILLSALLFGKEPHIISNCYSDVVTGVLTMLVLTSVYLLVLGQTFLPPR